MDHVLKILLKKRASPQMIGEFCILYKTYCQDNTEYICKRILKTSGYKMKKDEEYCKIYKQLVKFAPRSSMVANSNNLVMTKAMMNKIKNDDALTSDFKEFLKLNGLF